MTKTNFSKLMMSAMQELVESGIKIKEFEKDFKKENIGIKEIFIKHLGKEKGEEKYEGFLNKFGDFETFEGWYNLVGIPLNDRMKNFQLFKMEFNSFFGKEEKDYTKDILKILDETQHFKVEDDVIKILMATKSDKTEIPFKLLFISGEFNLKDKRYCGIFVYDTIIVYDKKREEKKKLAYGLYLNKTGKKEIGENLQLKFDFIDLDKKSDLTNFIYSFCNFINEPEVKIIEHEINPKNNKRRTERGLQTLPKENIIKISGELNRYITEFSKGLSQGFSHRFYVRGHFMNFWNEKKWKQIYKLSDEELERKKYSKVKGVIRKWKKPFIKGQGILTKNLYKVTLK